MAGKDPFEAVDGARLGPRRRWPMAAATLGALVICAFVGGRYPPLVWWRSASHIEAYLRRETPLGSSQESVRAWVDRTRRIQIPIHQGPVKPHSDYPVSTTGGASWATVVVSRGWITDIEAFYTFDATGHLADVRVRITHDGP